MKIIYAKSKWEMWEAPLTDYLERTKNSGFDATELFIPLISESPQEIIKLHQTHGLEIVAQIITQGNTPTEHLASLKERFIRALEFKPLHINCHTGRDIFSYEDNLKLFKKGIELSSQHNIGFSNETHRARPTYSAVETRKYLDALPEMRITADLSHWMVVHETDLKDQEDNVELAIERSDHIHARVGYAEGPQVTDPRAPEWKAEVNNHLEIWQKIVDNHRKKNSEYLTITPEFGPPNYMHTLPYTNEPVGDVWNINVYMKELLKKTLVL